MDKANKTMTMREAVLKSLHGYGIGQQFYGHELKQKVVELVPRSRNCYVDTVMRVARKVARDKYKCVDRSAGLYERI